MYSRVQAAIGRTATQLQRSLVKLRSDKEAFSKRVAEAKAKPYYGVPAAAKTSFQTQYPEAYARYSQQYSSMRDFLAPAYEVARVVGEKFPARERLSSTGVHYKQLALANYSRVKEGYKLRIRRNIESFWKEVDREIEHYHARFRYVKSVFETYQIFFTVSGALLSAGAAWFGYTSRFWHMRTLELRLEKMSQRIEMLHKNKSAAADDFEESELSSFDSALIEKRFTLPELLTGTVFATGVGYLIGYGVGFRRGRRTHHHAHHLRANRSHEHVTNRAVTKPVDTPKSPSQTEVT